MCSWKEHYFQPTNANPSEISSARLMISKMDYFRRERGRKTTTSRTESSLSALPFWMYALSLSIPNESRTNRKEKLLQRDGRKDPKNESKRI